MRGRPFISFYVAPEPFANAGAQHLDRDLPALGRDGAMHLRDRGSADRFLVEAGENLFERPPEAAFDLPADQREIHWGQSVLQHEQVMRGLLADQIGGASRGSGRA